MTVLHLSNADLTFVSIHIRRTDYIHHLEINGIGHSEVNQSYYHNAMLYFKERFEVNQSYFFIKKIKTTTIIDSKKANNSNNSQCF